jgi:hypothetical protein
MKIINKDGYLTKKAAFIISYMLSNNIAKHEVSLKNGRAVDIKGAIDLLDKYWYDDHMQCMEEGKDGYSIVGLESLYDKTQFSLVSDALLKDTHQENGQFTEEAAKIVFGMIIGGTVTGGLRCRNNNEIHDILGTKRVKSKYPYRINGFAYSPTLGFYVNETAQSDIVGFVTKADRKEFKRRWLIYCIAEYEKEHPRPEVKKAEYPKPVKTILENGTKYDYIWWAARGFKVSASVWNDKPEHMKRLSSRRIFGSKEEATQAATHLNTIMENV